MALDVLLLTVGFLLLYFGANWLVRGSSSLAYSLGVPPLVIGLTVVAFGTSAPELVVSVVASVQGKSMMAVGNVFGSNICNIALVLGLTAALRPIVCSRVVVRRDIPIMLAITAVTLFLCIDDRLDRWEGAILFAGVIAYTVMNYWFARRGAAGVVEVPTEEDLSIRPFDSRTVSLVIACSAVIAAAGFAIGDPERGATGAGLLLLAGVSYAVQQRAGLRAGSRVLQLLMIVAGIYGVVSGVSVVVDSASRIMAEFGVSQKFIGFTVVALGTSLPELATSVVAAMRREMDISIGNLVGSNVFNLLSVLGLAAIVRPIPIPGGFVGSGLHIEGAFMLFVCALPWFFLRKRVTVNRAQGFVLLFFYVAFLAYLIATAKPVPA